MNNEKIREVFKPNNSLSKHLKSENNKKVNQSLSIITKNRQIARKQIKEALHSLQTRNNLLKKLIENQKILNLNLTFYEEAPIIKIQSHVRRWLCIKAYEELKLIQNESNCKKSLQDLSKEVSAKLMMGDSTRSAMLLIVKNIKIFLWRRKIRRIKYVFENYYLKSTQNFLNVFTQTILVWSCRNKVDHMSYLRMRKIKLAIIRKNLAILTIKRAIREKRFNISVGRYLYQKIRRRRKRLFTFHTVQGPPHDVYGLTAHETLSWLLHDAEDDMSENDLRERENRMNLLKLAHGIKGAKSKSVSPVLGRKFCHSPSRSVVSQLSETQKYRNLSITTPPLTTYKRIFFNSELPPRLMAYPPASKPYARPLSCSSKVEPDKHFLKPTQFFLRKTLANQSITLKKKSKVRPPSHKLIKDTESSMAKRKKRYSYRTSSNIDDFFSNLH